MEAKLGDTLRLYDKVDNYWKEVQIVERIGYEEEVFIDTFDESDDSYGNTDAKYKTIEELMEAYEGSWNMVEVIRDASIQEQWSDLLNGDTLWVTKYELDEILDNLKSLNINTLMIQSCKDKFVVKVDELTVIKFKEAHNED